MISLAINKCSTEIVIYSIPCWKKKQKKNWRVTLSLCKFIKHGGANTEVWKINPGYCKIMLYYPSEVIIGIIDEILWLDWM